MANGLARLSLRCALAGWLGRAAQAVAIRQRELELSLQACRLTVSGLRRPSYPQAVRRARGAA